MNYLKPAIVACLMFGASISYACDFSSDKLQSVADAVKKSLNFNISKLKTSQQGSLPSTFHYVSCKMRTHQSCNSLHTHCTLAIMLSCSGERSVDQYNFDQSMTHTSKGWSSSYNCARLHTDLGNLQNDASNNLYYYDTQKQKVVKKS